MKPDRRVIEFPKNGLKVLNGKLYCSYCNKDVEFKKKSVVANHVRSESHKKKKGEGAVQPRLGSTVETYNNGQNAFQLMAKVFVGEGVPLHIFAKAKLRQWLANNLKDGKNLPSERTLRRYLVKEGETDIAETRDICRGKDVAIMVDETMDIKNRKIVNLLVAPLGEVSVKFRLLNTEILESCTSNDIVQFVIRSAQIGRIPLNNLVVFISDNVPYMLAAGRVLSNISARCLHSTCWAHILHLISEEIRGSLDVADSFIAKMKAALVKAPGRRNELLDCLESHMLDRKLPPVPVITRWTTWLEAGDYHCHNLAALTTWINSTTVDSKAIEQLVELISNSKLVQELEEISQIFPGLSSAIKTLEKSESTASEVMFQLETVRGHLQMFTTTEAAMDKLDLYLTTKHPARQFWHDVQFCDPRKYYTFSSSVALPASLQRFSTSIVPVMELIKYKTLCSHFTAPSDFSPFTFWKNHHRELPILSQVSMKALSVPASSAEVERSFSALKRLQSPARGCFTIENLSIHLRLQFNSTRNVEEIAQDMPLYVSDDESD